MSMYFESTGDFKKTQKWLNYIKRDTIFNSLSRFGEQGVQALERATPSASGETARSWYYEIKKDRGSYSIIWGNHNMAGDTPVAILIQYGHATGTGGYVQGRDFINPALQPIFDQIARDAWEAVTKA